MIKIKKMRKLINTIYIAVFSLSPLSGMEEVSFAEYESLDPEIDLLSNSVAGTIERKLFLFPQLASQYEKEYAYIYDATKNTAVKVLPEYVGFFPHTRMTYFWDPHTKINYGYIDTIRLDDNIRGWYTFTMDYNNRLMFSLQSIDKYWANSSPPRSKISDTRILTSKYGNIIRGRSLGYERDSKFAILDIYTEEKIWEDIVSYYSSVNIYWISGSWLFKDFGMREHTDTIYNYETGEKITLAPETIIGYGNGVILTSLKTGSGFTGITVWTTNKEILYRDKEFPLTGMAKGVSEYFSGQQYIYFSYYDFPYIYCNIGEILVGGPYATLIMNLKDKKTYISPIRYHLHGIFGFE
jgi:hypothetical protein